MAALPNSCSPWTNLTGGYSPMGPHGTCGGPGVAGVPKMGNYHWYHDEDIKNIIYELPKLGLNLDKISKLDSEEDKKRIIHMFTEICKMAIEYETRDNKFNSFHFKMLYNSLYNCDFLCTNRNKNLTNLLEDEK